MTYIVAERIEQTNLTSRALTLYAVADYFILKIVETGPVYGRRVRFSRADDATSILAGMAA